MPRTLTMDFDLGIDYDDQQFMENQSDEAYRGLVENPDFSLYDDNDDRRDIDDLLASFAHEA